MDVPNRLKESGNNMEINNSTASNTTGHQSPMMNSSVRSTNPNFSDKLTALMQNNTNEEEEERALLESQADSSYSTSSMNNNNNQTMFHRQHNFNNRDMELSLGNSDEEDEEEEEDEDEDEENDQRNLELHLQQIEREQGGDYGDIQFFHHKLLLQQHLGHNIGSSSSFGSANGLVNRSGGDVDSFHIEECDDNGISNNFSENPFVFPDNVMEYGEPQFFPGNCVGYLETIIEEESDQELDEEVSAHHWWCANSDDTDTDSVIRVGAATGKNLKSVENVEDLSTQSTSFRFSASSRPFELEDLHLLDQLDLAFEETLMEPRRRSGFAAFGHHQPLETMNLQHETSGKNHHTGALQRSVSHDGERSTVFFSDEDIKPHIQEREIIPYNNITTKNNSIEDVKLENAESKETFGSSLSPSSSDSPHEVAEEDFFYSSPEEESSEGSSSSDDSEKNVLASFSLCKGANGISGGGLSNNSFNGAFGPARNRRSFDSPSSSASAARLKSFRSFDSLNALSGTELLFAKADTFPSFHYIKEDVEPGSSGGSGSPSSPRCNLTSASTNDVPGATTRIRQTSGGEDESQSLPSDHSVPLLGFPPTFNKITKKNSYSSSTSTASSSSNSASGMMSTENLSEDSGIIPDGTGVQSVTQKRHPVLEENFSGEMLEQEHQTITQLERESAKDYISSAEFALNPLVFSSLSSCDGSSNNPSMNSVPSLNNHQTLSSPFVSSSFELDLEKTRESTATTTSKSNRDNDSTPNSHSSLLDSNLMKVANENTSFRTSKNPNTEETAEKAKTHNNLVEKEANQITDNQSLAKSHTDIDQATKPINGNGSFISINESCLHPYSNSDVQIQPKSYVSCSDSPDKTNFTELSEYKRVLDGKQDNAESKVTTDPLIEQSKAIANINVPSHSSSIPSQSSSSSTLRKKADIKNIPTEESSQQKMSIICTTTTQPDLVLQDAESPCSSTKRPHNSPVIKPDNAKEDMSIVISNSDQSQEDVGVHCGKKVGVPYIEENEIQEDTHGWNVNDEIKLPSTHSHQDQPTPPLSSLITRDGFEECTFEDQVSRTMQRNDDDSSDDNDMQEDSDEKEYQYQDYHNNRSNPRERSNSESEFESAESAVEEDSIALAYAIVNSPTKGSLSSSPTQELINKTINSVDVHVDFDGESGPVDLPRDCEQYADSENNASRNTNKENVTVGTPEDFFAASPSALLIDDDDDGTTGQKNSRSPSTGPDNVYTSNDNKYPTSGGMKNTSILLHNLTERRVDEEDDTHCNNNLSNSNSVNSKITYQLKQEAVCHEFNDDNIAHNPSRSVTLENSSSTDVVHQFHQLNSKDQFIPGNKVDKHLYPDQSDYISEEEELLVLAEPIHPVHIGVAEVKKFTQLDSSLSRKSQRRNNNQDNQQHEIVTLVGDSDSGNNTRPVPSSSNNIESGISKGEEAILGHSNFGFFGRSSSSSSSSGEVGNQSHSPSSKINLDLKSVGSTSSSPSTVHPSESTEISSYGFPTSLSSSYPISETNLHITQGENISSDTYDNQHWRKKVQQTSLLLSGLESGANSSSSSSSNKSGRKRHTRDKDQNQGVHLEDIKCGIHPENFTIPLGVYSAAVIAVAPSIPSKRLVFLNEGEQNIRIHEQDTIFKEKIVGSIKNQSSSSGSQSSSSNITKHTTSTFSSFTNGSSGTNTNTSSVPDVLVVKQTHLSGSECGSHTTRTPVNYPKTQVRMEVETNNPSNRGTGDRRSTSPSGVPIKTRTYGTRNEVEVVLVSSRTPSPASVGGTFTSSLKQHQPHTTSSSLGDEESNKPENPPTSFGDPPAKIPRTRVHFSPVVSEISWRESYIDQSSEFSGSSEDLHTTKLDHDQSDFSITKSGATTITSSRDSCGVGSGIGNYDNSGADSVVRPLFVPTDRSNSREREMSHQVEHPVRQPSPGITGSTSSSSKGPILVEKVEMRSSFLHGVDDDDDEEEYDELERKLTMDIRMNEVGGDNSTSPVDQDGNYYSEPYKENIEFKSGMRKLAVENGHGVLDLYEDVHVEIEPINNKSTSGSTTLSMVPDLLSQCENATNAQTHIDVRIEEVESNKLPKPFRKSHSPTPQHSLSEIPPPPMMMETGSEHHYLQQQQQILPKIFAEDVNPSKGNGSKNSDSKTNSSSSLNKTKIVLLPKGFTLGSKKSGEKDNNSNKEKDIVVGANGETEVAKENKAKGNSNKPGFFERLSKIRLSGSKPKKQKVHPKTEDEVKGAQPLRSANAVNINGNSNGSTSKPQQTILKKSPANQPTPVIPNYDNMENDSEPEESHHQAFENILEEIAGIKSIKIRMDKSTNNGTPERVVNNSTSPPVKEMRSFAKRKQFYNSNESTDSPPVSSNTRSCSDLDRKLSQFKEDTSRTRDLVSKSHPDLELIEDMVRQQSISPEPGKSASLNKNSTTSPPEPKKSPKKSQSSETGQKNEREWYKLLKSAAEKYYYRGSNKTEDKEIKSNGATEAPALPIKTKTGIFETDLDTGASREMLDAELVELDKSSLFCTVSTSEIPSAIASASITTTASSPSTKARSLTNLSTRLPLSVAPSCYNDDDVNHGELNDFEERAKSYEFLLDDNQKSSSVPPENKLRLETRQLSEHELSIQRSLQRLNVPEWFKKHEVTSGNSTSRDGSTPTDNKPGNLKILNKKSEYGSTGGLAGGWAGLSAFKAPSMSSLQSSNGGRYSGSLNRSNFVRGRPATMSATMLSKESLVGTGSASHSPSAYDRCSFTYGMPFSMTRFSQSRMSTNSGSITPNSTTPDASLLPTTASYVKKPYLGWRSQERLNNASNSSPSGPPKLSVYLPPEERLANDLLKSKVTIRPPLSDRPPLPKPPPRSDKTALSKTSSIDNQQGSITSSSSIPSSSTTKITSSVAVVTKINQHNSIPLPNYDEQSPKAPNVHESIREVTKAINQFVSKGEEGQPKPQPRKKSPGKKSIWMESSFVGQKPVSK